MESSPLTADPDAGLTLGPRSIERPADAGWTLIAGVDDPTPGRLDGGGLLQPDGADWLIDWWIGADDRWYLPAREPTVRQRRIGPGPIVETSVRVPSGDVVSCAYPVLAGGRRGTVIEIRNDSPAPVALALALRPIGLDGRPASLDRLEVGGDAITVDGRVGLILPRPANQVGVDGQRDLLDDVQAGTPLGRSGPAGGSRANAVVLYPLPHATSLRFVVPAGAGDAGPLRPDGLPDADVVATGWTTIVERPATFALPDPGLSSLAGAARARLILAAPELPARLDRLDPKAAVVLAALARGGHAGECRDAIGALAAIFPTGLPADDPGAGADVLAAAAAAAELCEAERAEDLLEAMTQLALLVERAGQPWPTTTARLALARLASYARQPEAAAHLRSLVAADRQADPSSVSVPELEPLTELAERAGPAASWPPDDDAVAAARFWTMAASLLVDLDDRTDPTRPVIQLLPAMPSAWMGGEIEVHRAPMAGLRVSFAIRWHGYRPALLWEVDGVDPDRGPGPFRLTCPGLDPDWSTTQAAGEALLAGTGDALPEAPAPGDSFI